jgi:FG-GAP-like repeat/Bacterial pre-peptidase C-terminal domain
MGHYQRTFVDRVDRVDPLDYYKFQVVGRSRLSVSIGQLSGDVTLSLLKGDGTLLQSSANSAAASELVSQLLEPGIYYLQVVTANVNEESDYALDFALKSTPKVDIAWRHTAGHNTVWGMNGSGQSNVYGMKTLSDPNWQMVGVGDFNGDSQTDYLWRHLPTGQNAIWFMNNGEIVANLSLPKVDPTWRINLAADLNNDGKSDILWQSSTGQNNVWYMDGQRVIGTANFLALADRNWTLSAAGDFNGDGRTDLVWRHGPSGSNVV